MVGVGQTFTERLPDARLSVMLFHVVLSIWDSLHPQPSPLLFLRLLTWG